MHGVFVCVLPRRLCEAYRSSFRVDTHSSHFGDGTRSYIALVVVGVCVCVYIGVDVSSLMRANLVAATREK